MQKNSKESVDQASLSKSAKSGSLRLAWGITGAGDLMSETFKTMEELSKNEHVIITAMLSKAAVKVIKLYGLWSKLPTITDKVLVEEDSNTPFVVGALQTGKYDLLLVAPTTANSVAKIVHGIADTMITNAVAMTNKTSVQVYILPVEKGQAEVTTTLPDGKLLKLKTRSLDTRNTEELRKMEGVSVLEAPEDIKKIVPIQ